MIACDQFFSTEIIDTPENHLAPLIDPRTYDPGAATNGGTRK